MNKDKALDILKTINYPGFNRDIVSFGMVQNVSVDGNNITVKLNINTQNEEKKRTVIELIENKLDDHFETISVELIAGAVKQATIPSSSQQEPIPGKILSDVEHVVAIASGKGGFWKSTVAANLASGLAQ